MIHVPKGTKDVLPRESYKWHYIEEKIRQVVRKFYLSEIRTPTFEATELFARGVGDTTDIVNKEMYTFDDKGGRSMTLKPEGTAGVARSVIENSLYNDLLPRKMYYVSPVFRYERPQAGRLREHHQFGVEIYGADTPASDVEVISIARELLISLGITELELYINSIGCSECRADYNSALKDYLASNIDNMCGLCQERYLKNPLRVLDCKQESCQPVSNNAPSIQDYLCEECLSHQNQLASLLDTLGISFAINPRIVRGLDYYTKTVFEFVSSDIGAQGTVCGGGRYNNLSKEVGGLDCPAVGFGMGIERLIMVMENLNISFGESERAELYIAPLEGTLNYCIKLGKELRDKGLSIDIDIMERGLKAQMKYANKSGARYIIVVGDTEIESGKVNIKNMDSGEQELINIGDIHSYLKGA